MNINFYNLSLQFAAMGVWVFMAAGIVAILEKVADKYFPGFLALEAAGASQSPGQIISRAPVATDVTTKA